ncbi:MAG: hypothetical protein ACOYXB_06630 [Bacteroidota bacterium]
MKKFILLFGVCIPVFGFAQHNEADSLLQLGKEEFNKPYTEQNHRQSAAYLEQAVQLDPLNAEAHYFLAYAYSRINSADGGGIADMNISLTLKCSEQFEIVNRLEPEYKGEQLVLDPYSKLSAEWSSQALCYLYNDKADSAFWAFKQGRQRGGFSDFSLCINRKVLDLCPQNAILVSSGDNFTLILLYLQVMENYRTDVSVIDVSLLDSEWYPDFLLRKQGLNFGIPEDSVHSMSYSYWSDTPVSIEYAPGRDFSWVVGPSYYDAYLLRSDRLLLSLLTANGFSREVCFTTAFNRESMLGLWNYTEHRVLVDRVNYDQRPAPGNEEFLDLVYGVLNCLPALNPACQGEKDFIDYIRYSIFLRVFDGIQNGDTDHARELLQLVEDRLNPQTEPYRSESGMEYLEYLRNML